MAKKKAAPAKSKPAKPAAKKAPVKAKAVAVPAEKAAAKKKATTAAAAEPKKQAAPKKKAAAPAKKKAAAPAKKTAAPAAKPVDKVPAKKKAVAKKSSGKPKKTKKQEDEAAARRKASAQKRAEAKLIEKKAAAAVSAQEAAKQAEKRNAPAKPKKAVKITVFVKKQHQKLLDLRDALVDQMNGVTRDSRSTDEASAFGMHQADAGSDAYDRDFALNLISQEQDALHQIDNALRRIQQGTYGICEESGEKIPQARLEAQPFARLTVRCQELIEREEMNGQYRPSMTALFGANDMDLETVSED